MTQSVQRTLTAAREALRGGDLERAESLCRGLLQRDPSLADAQYVLGRVELHRGRDAEAVGWLRLAMARLTASPLLHGDLAVALQNLGRNDEAIAEARRAIELSPGHLSALNTLGNALLALGRPGEACEPLERAVAIEPRHALLRLNCASALREAGRLDEALEHCRLAAALEPNVPETPDALVLRADIERGLGRLEAARATYASALARDPDRVAALLGIAQCASELGDPAGALESLTRAATLRTGNAELENAIGGVLRALGRADEARAAYARALAAWPEYAEAHCNLSTLALDAGDLEAAVAHADRAIAADPRLADPRWNLAQVHLARGQWDEGFRLHEYRRLRSGAAELALPWPEWTGGATPGATLFVAAEQGVGDEILFASCVPDVVRDVPGCVLECDPRLVPLFARSFPAARVVPRLQSAARVPAEAGEPDGRIAIGTLPMLYRNAPEDFPARPSYLVPDPAAVDDWRERLGALGQGLTVGISWRGGRDPLVQRVRSIPLTAFSRLATAGHVRLIDLQYGDTAAERDAARRDMGLEPHHWDDVDPLVDLDGFAALIAALDLVISIDNSTVHLAGAVGAPCWVLLPRVADWRWLLDREDSPWYSSVRLFRQRRAGDWDDVIGRVAAELDRHPPSPGPRAAVQARPEAPAPHRAHRPRRERAAVLNDTSHWYHWGCAGTSAAIIAALTERGHAVTRIPITSLGACAEPPATLEEFDDPVRFERFRRANPWLLRELEPVDRVIVNGEGTLHGLDPDVLTLLYITHAARRHLGKHVEIINHSCYPEGAAEASDSGLWRLYRTVYSAVDFVAIREPASFGLMTRAGLDAVLSFDCLPLTIARRAPGLKPRRGGVVLAGSAAAVDADLGAWISLARDLVARRQPVRVVTGASLFPAADERRFAAALAGALPGAIEVVTATSLEQWLEAIGGAAALVSGRFHHTIAAASLGTPFVLVQSNSPKNSGLASALQAPPPIALDAPDLATELERQTRAALGRGRDTQARDRQRLEELCGLAARNFSRLDAAVLAAAR